MDDPISRQDAIDAVKKLVEWYKEKWHESRPTSESVIDVLNDLPSAEPEIIRCKDCKWCVEHYDTDENAPYWVCKNWDGGTDADGYCHEAERKES